MSNIDPSVPPQGNPSTSAVRANFAAAKAEIEALQAFAKSSEVNVINYMSAAQYTAWQAGTINFDAGACIQNALNYAAGLVSAVGTQLAATVRVPAGLGQIQAAQLSVPARVTLDCEGVIQNGLASSATPCVVFATGSHCKRLIVDANSKNGVTFGAVGVDASMNIGFCYVFNVDTGAGIGAQLLGNRISFDHIRTQGGSVGVDFGDNGATATPNRIFGDRVHASQAGVGLRLTKANICSVSRVTTDSCSVTGVKVDLSHEVILPNIECFWDDANGGTKYSSNPINIGASSGADNVSGLVLCARVFNTGSAYAAVVANLKTSWLLIDCATTGSLSTGTANPITTAAINFGASVDATNSIIVHCNSGLTGHAGTAAGAYIERTSAVDTLTQSLAILGGITVGPANEATAIKAIYNSTILDTSFTNQTTPQSFGMAVTVAANETWTIEYSLDIGAALATTGLILQPSAPTGATINVAATLVPDVSGSATIASRRTSTSGANLNFPAANLTGVGSGVVKVMACIQNGANAGVIELKLAQATSSATALTARTGSKVAATRLV